MGVASWSLLISLSRLDSIAQDEVHIFTDTIFLVVFALKIFIIIIIVLKSYKGIKDSIFQVPVKYGLFWKYELFCPTSAQAYYL